MRMFDLLAMASVRTLYCFWVIVLLSNNLLSEYETLVSALPPQKNLAGFADPMLSAWFVYSASIVPLNSRMRLA